MTTFTLILTIAAVDFISTLSPGQDFAIITRNTLKYSRRIGYWTVLGLGSVTFLHTLLAVFGLSAIITNYPEALAFIKTAGALYLIYLGTGFIKKARNLTPVRTQFELETDITSPEAFKMGAIANLLNAEAIIAFVSVFALFMSVDTATWIKLTTCAVLTTNTVIWYALFAKLFSLVWVQQFLQTRMKRIEQIIGVILVFLGYKNLMSVRNNS